MVSVMVLFPGRVICPCVLVQDITRVRVGVGEKLGVGLDVTLGEMVTVGVFVIVGVGEGSRGVSVGVGVLVGVGVGVDVGVFVGVDVSGCQLEGGAVTKIDTLTMTVRALCALMALFLASERSMKPTILGTTGR
jgi:hypothetical protein